MSGDPFADGMPAGDHHMWVRAQGAPCPHCECCTVQLCLLAIEKGTACHHEAGPSNRDLAACPCWLDKSAARLALRDRMSEDAEDAAAFAQHDAEVADGTLRTVSHQEARERLNLPTEEKA